MASGFLISGPSVAASLFSARTAFLVPPGATGAAAAPAFQLDSPTSLWPCSTFPCPYHLVRPFLLLVNHHYVLSSVPVTGRAAGTVVWGKWACNVFPQKLECSRESTLPSLGRGELFWQAIEAALIIPSLPSLLIKSGEWPGAAWPPSMLAGSISPELKTNLDPGSSNSVLPPSGVSSLPARKLSERFNSGSLLLFLMGLVPSPWAHQTITKKKMQKLSTTMWGAT